ncbi:shikimate dehydrogenase [Paenibacillus larvae]|uniref:Shikimate dehydrogenase (NADP(+)) n=3 Tax=Paenibacillus larvae TaxID=1464 RepID=V9W6Z0_9BACL|nr:shikimate dehydrogenase [Paenibacillus larvae]AHD04857.1 shikimate dehydrogenase AroE [Paenibacillus larvae subsp. larvae DSM 25430]AQR77490.1 shikimate dehydrogenase [Paenibacillus larvae subsp. larvae]AQZ45411.1 shikimate dehydrogenase [Paenibacillus larvae subsp. pulvifaciens]AVF21472.1 shikimate dehydrogenase AroE [Paenibacillus larvae subsp. larvae]AVF27370.1 shikimate dehydrogenase AroE [Paenibacillus larvae subsp. larvae]
MTSWQIDSQTRLFGVMGNPVFHSKSPVMMNRAFRETGFNGIYTAFHVQPDDLGKAIAGLRAVQVGGLNVTIPHKVEVIRYLDDVDESATMIGAVNTIINENGKLTGYNTDGIGYVRALKEETGFDPSGKTILLLGAGGAARGVAYALAKSGAACICIANRTVEKAEQLASFLSPYTKTKGMGLSEIGNLMDNVHLIVNTTSAGMAPNEDEVPYTLTAVPPGFVASDLIYNPMKTAFLKQASKLGAIVHSGLGMFIYQGAYAFEYWTCQKAPVQAMREAVLQSLKLN